MVSAVFIFLFFPTIFCKESYERSIFGHPGTDEVHNEFVDGFEVLQTGLPHPKLNPVRNGKYSSQPIEDDDYPWPNHDYKGSCTPELLIEEKNSIAAKYHRTDLTQEEVHWHPAAAAQWYTTQEELNKADRVKVKFTIQKYHFHFLPAFIPPGELVTLEIPEIAAQNNEVGMTYNLNARGSSAPLNNRLPDMVQTNIRVRQNVSHIASPYGASITLYYDGPDPIDVILTGVILQPYFIYGCHSDEEWEQQLSKLPGPIAYIDSGNLVHLVPASFVRDSYRMNDCMHYWRSAIQISQTTAKDVGQNMNPRYGRIIHPCVLRYDTWVPAGAACAYPAGNFCHFPCDWIGSTVGFTGAIDNPWGTVHEIDHHHQEGWAMTQEAGEMSNNAVNLVIYAKTNICSGPRSETGWPRYAYASYMLNNNESYGLARYSTLLHFFGVDKFKEFVKSDQENAWYPRQTFGNAGAEMLRASRVFNRNMRYHWNFYSSSDEVLDKNGAFAELNKLNLKPFHPVTTVYAVGAIVDGVAFRTARPYQIETTEQTIDFVGTMTQRENKEWFGDFEYVGCQFEKGRENAWKEQSKGVFLLTPKSNMLEDEQVNVSYRDKTTNEIHIVLCEFTQFYSSNAICQRTIIGGIPNSKDNLFDAYRYISQNLSEDTKSFVVDSSIIKENGMANRQYTNNEINTWLSILEGKLTPPETNTYAFSCTGELQIAFYLSETPLKGDPDKDIDSLLNYQPSRNLNYETSNRSEIYLEYGKTYYFRHIVFPQKGSNRMGQGWIGFKIANSTDSFKNMPQSWFKFSDKELTEEEKFNNQFKPDFERIYLMDKYQGITFLQANRNQWDVYKVPKGTCVINSNSHEGTSTTDLTPTDVLTDSNPTTEYRVNWWPSSIALQFPHIFEIDMGEETLTSFSSIKIGKTGNTNFYPMNNYVSIYLAPFNYSLEDEDIPYKPENYSINHPESLIWSGYFDTATMEYIDLGETVTGRYLKFEFINNSLKWKDENPGRTCISSIEVGQQVYAKKVYPMTNRKYILLQNHWDETRGGLYYNGKGYTGYAKQVIKSAKKNSILEIRIPKGRSEFGIIGDYYPGMGSAIVTLDGNYVGTIKESLYQAIDNRKLLRASRSYESLLFYMNNLDSNQPHLFVIEVDSGSVTFAGFLTDQFLVDWTNDDGTYEQEYSQEQLYNFSQDSGGLSAGAIAAIVIAVILAAAGIAIGIFVMYKKEVGCFSSRFRDKSSDFGNPFFSSLV